ncbi:MAG: hypothetical protein PUD20_02870 [bacterium]|nr:hypothetical protein [bacterium]
MTYMDVKQIIWTKMKQASHRSVLARSMSIVLVAVYLLCLHLYRNIRKQMNHPKRVIAMMLAMLLALPNPYLVRADELAPVEASETTGEEPGVEPEESDAPEQPEETVEPENTEEPQENSGTEVTEEENQQDAELENEIDEEADPNAYNLSIIVTAPDENLEYPEDFIPTVDIQVTNTGEEPLTGLSVAAEGFDLWYALDPLGEFLPWNFISEVESEDIAEEELPEENETEEEVKDSASEQPTDEVPTDTQTPEEPVADSENEATPDQTPDLGDESEAENNSDTNHEETTEVPEVPGAEVPQEEPTEELIEYAEFVGVSFDEYNLPDTLEPGATIYFRTQLSEEYTMQMLVEAFSLRVAEIEAAYTLPYVFEETDSVTEEDALEKEEPEKEETEEEPALELDHTLIQVLERAGGYSMGETFFAMGEACYYVAVDESLAEIEYCLGSISGVVTVENGIATIPISGDVNDKLRVFYRDENGEQRAAVEEYVVNETDAPRVVFERMETEEASYVHVTLVEKGEIKSGIREFSVFMDDEEATVDSQIVQKSISLVSGQSVPTIIEFDLPLTGAEEHEFDITVQDYAGNARHKCFTMSALESEIVSVVLPTTFKLLVLPENDQYQVIGEDFYVQNRSGFPVTISLDHSSVSIDPEIPEVVLANQVIELGNDAGEVYHLQAPDTDMEKRCDLSLNLIRANGSEESYVIPEGDAYDVMSFDLQKSECEEDDELTVQSQGFEASRELTPDMAILNVRGVIARGTEHLWRENDLKIRMVFHFTKSGDIEEELTEEELEALEKERLEKERLEKERLEQEVLENEAVSGEEPENVSDENQEEENDIPVEDNISDEAVNGEQHDEGETQNQIPDQEETLPSQDTPDASPDDMSEGSTEQNELPIPVADEPQMPAELSTEGGKSEDNP